jgi:cytochrome c551/c552
MNAFDRLALLPTAGHLPLLEPLMFLMLLFFLPFVGVLIVSTAGSLLALPRYPELARDLINTGPRSRATWFVFGLLPLIVLTFLFTQLLAGATAHVGSYLTRVLAIAIAAFALLYVYQLRRHPAAGLAGLALLLGAAFHFVASWTLLSYPEKWDLVRGPLPFLFSIQVVINTLLLLGLGAALAGGAVLLVYFQWPERTLHTPEADRPLLRGLGIGASLGGALLAPPLILWKLYTAPIQGLSPDVYRSAVLLLVVLLVAALADAAMIRGRHTRFAYLSFIAGVAAFGLFAHQEQALHANAMKEQHLALAARADVLRQELVAEREALYASSQDLGIEAGARIYRERCSACHQFDRKVVGPAYNDVLPKYEGKFDDLAGFILAPRKVDPAFPAMPNQGLKRAEARAVAAYLWKERSGVDPTATAGGEPGSGQATGGEGGGVGEHPSGGH